MRWLWEHLQWLGARGTDQKVLGGLILFNLIGLVFLIVSGLIKNVLDISLHRRKVWTEKQIAFLENQLSTLYGPVYSLLQTNQTLLSTLRERPTLRDHQQRFMKDVIIPNNLKVVTILQANFHLMEPSTLSSALEFMAHAAWQHASGGTSGTVPSGVLPFPGHFATEISSQTTRLKDNLTRKRDVRR